MAFRLIALGIAVILSASPGGTQAAAAAATVLEGTATVIDGDTVEIHGQRIRLDAIDAPESRQRCLEADGTPYPCGRRAAFALADKIGRAPVKCVAKGRDRYGRIIATCFQAGTNLNGWMVDQGWAVAFRRYGNDYAPHEDKARTHRRGIWAGRFDMPWDWRRQTR